MARIGTSATDRVDLDSTNLFSGATTSGTLAFWFKPATAHATRGTVLGVGGGAGTPGAQAFWSAFLYADEKLGINFRPTDNGAYSEVKTNGAATLNAWNHGILQSSGTAWSFWLNGASQGLTVAAGSNNGAWLGDASPSNTPKTVLLGLWNDGGYLQGCLDMDVAEVGLWNGVQLGAGEIAALAAGYAPAFIRPASLSAYWDLRRTVFDRKAYRSGQTVTGTSVTAHPRMIYPTGLHAPSLIAWVAPSREPSHFLPQLAPILAQ